MALIYSPDGTNVYGSEGTEFEKVGSVQAVESCKIVFVGGTSYSLFQTLLLPDASFSHNKLRHRQTDRQTDDIIMPTADPTGYSSTAAKK